MVRHAAGAIGVFRSRPRKVLAGIVAVFVAAILVGGVALRAAVFSNPGGPSVSIGLDSAGAELKPRLTPSEVIADLRPSLVAADEIVAMKALRLDDLASLTGEDNGPSGIAEAVLWYVQVIGPAPSFPPMPWGAGDSGWMVLEDSNARLIGAGGWGFVSAANSPNPPSPRPPLPDGLIALKTTNWLETPDTICAGVGLDAVLHGSPNDPYVAWLENRVVAGRDEIVWPAGYRARFSPNLDILDESGIVVLREGDAISGSCVTGLGAPWGITSPSK
jgi:hypothetical protein